MPMHGHMGLRKTKDYTRWKHSAGCHENKTSNRSKLQVKEEIQRHSEVSGANLNENYIFGVIHTHPCSNSAV